METRIDDELGHLFRKESGRMVAVLVKVFGTAHLELAEDVVQDALVSALETWKFNGVPNNPRAWLYKSARNKAIDIIRKSRHSETFDFNEPGLKLLESEYTLSTTMEQIWEDGSIEDNFLGMMFACCQKGISEDNQITLILKSLCGFSTKEIARSFLTSEDVISKRLYRTKEYFRKNNLRPTIPAPHLLAENVEAVLAAIYLVFNEGYNSTESDKLIREELISQALFLCKTLVENEKTRTSSAYALLALMCFHASRSASRITTHGQPILLANQDRTQWNHELISAGNDFLNQAAYGDTISHYHLEAAIAYEHCISRDFESTNWKAIVGYYDQLLQSSSDPILQMNRAMAISKLQGAAEAMRLMENPKLAEALDGYYLYHACMGELTLVMGQVIDGKKHFERAISLTKSLTEKDHFARKINAVHN